MVQPVLNGRTGKADLASRRTIASLGSCPTVILVRTPGNLVAVNDKSTANWQTCLLKG
jgi:hypothetical protein